MIYWIIDRSAIIVAFSGILLDICLFFGILLDTCSCFDKLVFTEENCNILKLLCLHTTLHANFFVTQAKIIIDV